MGALRALSRLLDLAAALGMGTTAERPRITVVPMQHNVKIARAIGAPIVLPRTPRQRRQQRRLVGIALVAAWPLVSQIARRPSTKSAQPVVRLGARPYWWFRKLERRFFVRRPTFRHSLLLFWWNIIRPVVGGTVYHFS